MSHNPPNPELLDTLDTAGFLVMNENRNFGNHTTWIDDFVSRKNNRAFRCIRTIGSVHSFKNSSSALYYIKRICFNGHPLTVEIFFISSHFRVSTVTSTDKG